MSPGAVISAARATAASKEDTSSIGQAPASWPRITSRAWPKSNIRFTRFTAQKGSNSPFDVGFQDVTGSCLTDSHNTSGGALRVSGSQDCGTAAASSVKPASSAVKPLDLENPRQDFLRNSVGGLFLHWGLRTAPAHTSCTAWENDVTSGGWTPDYWVKEAQKLHTQYLVLATFHSRLGYARPWPSKIPGSCATKRDFLGELITAAKAKGLKVVLYMTDDPQWHDEGGHEWLDDDAGRMTRRHLALARDALEEGLARA